MNNRIYVAGPMTGYPKHNFPAFDAAAQELRDSGWEAVSPADLDRMLGITEESTAEECAPKMEALIRTDLDAILTCDWMMMLRGWEKSTGARAEHALAVWRGMKIIYQENP